MADRDSDLAESHVLRENFLFLPFSPACVGLGASCARALILGLPFASSFLHINPP